MYTTPSPSPEIFSPKEGTRVRAEEGEGNTEGRTDGVFTDSCLEPCLPEMGSLLDLWRSTYRFFGFW